MPKLWIVIYEHRHGTDVWPVTEELSEAEIIASLDDFEEDRGERVELRGPFVLQNGVYVNMQGSL
jgi:hypothetical protein